MGRYKYVDETYKLIVRHKYDGSMVKYRDELIRQGFYFEEDLEDVSGGFISGKAYFSDDRSIEDVCSAFDFCYQAKSLELECYDEYWSKLDVQRLYNENTKLSEDVNVIMPDKTERRIGKIFPTDRVFAKQVKKSRDYFKKFGGWSILVGLIEGLEERGITKVRVYDRENGICYFTFLSNFKRFGNTFVDKYEGEQLVLHEKFWWIDCYNCPLYAVDHGPQVGASGPKDAELMFVGEAPWVDEAAAGKPFVGAAGSLLTKILEDVGINRDKCWITNSCLCVPPEINKVKKPPREALFCCKGRLMNEIINIKPKIIVALGKTACEVLMIGSDKETMTELQKGRRVIEVETIVPGTWIIPMYHPSYILRNKGWEEGSPRQVNRQRARFLAECCKIKEIQF